LSSASRKDRARALSKRIGSRKAGRPDDDGRQQPQQNGPCAREPFGHRVPQFMGKLVIAIDEL
jgi:hypothetical protein